MLNVKQPSTGPICQKLNSRYYRRIAIFFFVIAVIMLVPGLLFILVPLFWPQGDLLTVELGIGAVLSSLGLACLIVSVVCIIRWVRPGCGKLARSIHAQLAPEEAADYTVHFAQIDADIRNGADFGAVRFGSKWVVGEQAMLLENLCGVFALEFGHGRFNTEYNICVVDCNRRIQITRLPSREDMKRACNYALGLCPNAATGGYRAYRAFIGKKRNGMEAFQQRVAEARSQREQTEAEILFSFTDATGSINTNANWNQVSAALERLQAGEQVQLAPSRYLPCAQGASSSLGCAAEKDGYRLTAACWCKGEALSFAHLVDLQQASAVFQCYLEQQQPPNTDGWAQVEATLPGATRRRGDTCTMQVDSETTTGFSFSTVARAFRGLEEGAHGKLELSWPQGRTMAVTAPRKTVYVVQITGLPAQPNALLETTVSDRSQALHWLSDFYQFARYPATKGWKEPTATSAR